MYKIRDWLYTGDYISSTSAGMLAEHKIGAILQLFRPLNNDDIPNLYLAVKDAHPVEPMYFDQGKTFIKEQVEQDRRLLVACGAGVSRSVVFAMLALREVEGLTMREAYLDIVAKNTRAMPDHLHWDSLSDYTGDKQEFWEVWQEVMGLD